MPRIVDAADQRRAIRRAARGVFARRGVTGTGLARVAEAAGMGRSSLYHYYPDKASLVRDLVRDVLAEEEALFRNAAAGAGRPLERIVGLVSALAGTFDDWRAVGRMLLDLRARDARRFRGFFRRARAALAELVEEGQRAGQIDPSLDAGLTAATLIGAVDGILLQFFVEPAAFPDRDALERALTGAARKVLRP